MTQTAKYVNDFHLGYVNGLLFINSHLVPSSAIATDSNAHLFRHDSKFVISPVDE